MLVNPCCGETEQSPYRIWPQAISHHTHWITSTNHPGSAKSNRGNQQSLQEATSRRGRRHCPPWSARWLRLASSNHHCPGQPSKDCNASPATSNRPRRAAAALPPRAAEPGCHLPAIHGHHCDIDLDEEEWESGRERVIEARNNRKSGGDGGGGASATATRQQRRHTRRRAAVIDTLTFLSFFPSWEFFYFLYIFSRFFENK